MTKKLIRVKRTINAYLRENNNIQNEISIDSIPFGKLENVVFPQNDDPLLYDGYVLSIEQMRQLNAYLTEKISLDFDQYFYVLECYGIYE